MIKKQIVSILNAVKKEEIGEQYREVAIWLIDEEDSLNFIVDNYIFEYEIDEEWLLVKYNGGQDDDPVLYSHCVRLSQIKYITDEV